MEAQEGIVVGEIEKVRTLCFSGVNRRKELDVARQEARGIFGRDWTKGSLIGNLWSLSWPVMIGNSLNMLGPTVDMIWVGRLGAPAIAGVGVAGIAVMLVQSAFMGLFMGLRAMVARFIGAGDEASAHHVSRQALVVGAASSLLVAVIGIFLAEPILHLVGVEPAVVAQGATYLRILFIGSMTMSFRFMTESIMQASGDTRTPMKLAFISWLLHVALDPFLIFGWWVFPRMGVSGAALTNVLSQGLGTGVGFWYLFSGRTRLRLTLRNFRLDPAMIWRMVKIGLPASVMGIERSLSQFVLIRLMVPFGTLAVAAHSLGQRVEMILFMPAMGLGMAASVLVGQNLGAGQPERAERSGWLAAGLVEAFTFVCSLAILVGAESVIHIFSSEPALVKLASTFLRIAAAGYIVMGFAAVLQICISGSGDTLPPMLVGLLSTWLIQIPLAFFLPRVTELGVYGVRWAIVAGMMAGGITLAVYFRLGRWKRKKI